MLRKHNKLLGHCALSPCFAMQTQIWQRLVYMWEM